MSRTDLSLFRKVEVQDPVDAGAFVDVTRQLGSIPVIFEEEETVTDKLEFRIIHGAAFFIETLAVGNRVRFTGGYRADRSGIKTKKVFFNGPVSNIRPVFPDNGKLELVVQAEDDLFQLTRNKPGRVTYPGVKRDGQLYKRNFHFADSITISEIITGIVSEYNIPIRQVKVDSEFDGPYKLTDPISQNESESDYEFLLRITTGRAISERSERDRRKRPNKLINAHVRMSMEVNQDSGIAEFHAVPEEDLIGDEASVSFIYHSEGATRISPQKFDPTDKDATLIIKGVSISENPDQAASKEVQRHQDVQPGAKGSDALTPREDEIKPRGSQILEETIPPDFFDTHVIDEAKVKRDVDAGILVTSDVVGAVFAGTLKWVDVKHYFVLREAKFEAPSRNMSNKPEDLELPETPGTETSESEKVLGKSSGGRGSAGTKKSVSKVHKPRVKAYGQTLGFSCHGNIFVLCRRTYNVQFPVGRYTGAWFASRVVHTFGPTYIMEMQMGR